VIVALDLERDGDPVARVDDAGVLSGPLENSRALGRETPQQESRVLVAAVLRPEEGEDGKLEVVGLALEQGTDPVELPVRKAERAMKRQGGALRDRGQDDSSTLTTLHDPTTADR
jgi:hypothetical protein